jgi:hypothetical protein
VERRAQQRPKTHGLIAYQSTAASAIVGFENTIEEHEPIAVPVPDKAGK